MALKTPRLAVIGGGIIGLAVARQFLQDYPGAEVDVLEKEAWIAGHQSGRNSGVVHAGIYYAPGSAKSVLCRRGVGLLKEFCAEHRLDYEECGKLVVARHLDEMARLDRLAERATAAGVPGLVRLGPEGMKDREPHVRGVAALYSPSTAIVDFAAVARAMASDVVSGGGAVRCRARVTAMSQRADGVEIVTTDGARRYDRVVISAGLQSDRLARMAGGSADPGVVPFRGEYYELRPEARGLVKGLVYPVPDPRYPFLGVHFTRRVDGRVDVGPNAVLALAREGYSWGQVDLTEMAQLLAWPGFWRMAGHHWRTGIAEVLGSASKRVYARRAGGYIPELVADDLVPRPAGVRAQAVNRRGVLVDDFVIETLGPVVAVRNAPSPAATSSLAIAERICHQHLGTG